MNRSKALVGLIALFYIASIVFKFRGDDLMASSFSSVLHPLIALVYFISVKKKTW